MSDFWKNKRVTLLGGASLIGSHLAEVLVERGAIVKVVDDFSVGKTSNINHLPIEVRRADLRWYGNACDAVWYADVVFHLAAQHGGRGYVASHEVELYDNLSLDALIFRACSAAGVGSVIFSSSACAYPIHLQDTDAPIYLHEDMIDYNDLKQPDGAYGTEKLIGEKMLDAYIKRGDFAGCSTRSFTVYGPRMNESHAIAAMIAKTMIKQEPFEIWGNGIQIRNWTFVRDNVDGALLAAEHLDRGAINIGVEDRLTPNLACNIIWDIMGWRPKEIVYQTDKPIGPFNRVAQSQKLKSLGWRPNYTFRGGLELTIDWYTSTHSVEELKKTLERKLTER